MNKIGRRSTTLLVLATLVTSLAVYAGGIVKQAVDAAHWILKQSTTYSEKENYSKVIPHVLLGYDANGDTLQGIAMRSFKTYERVTALIALKRQDDQIVIDVVDIPDIGVIKDIGKQLKVLDALKGVSGTVVQDASGKRIPIDGVTGATRYQKRISLYLDKMAEALLQEMKQDPGWSRKPVKKQ